MGSRSRSIVFGTVVSGLITLQTSVRAADDPARDEARRLAYAGVAAYQASDYKTASEKLERAFGMLPAPSVGLYSARTLVKLGKLIQASARYRQISQLAITAGERKVQEDARKDASADLAALTPRIPGLLVQLEGATADQVQIVLDGNIVSAKDLGAEILLDPGTHTLQGRRDAQVVGETIELQEQMHTSVVLRFAQVVAPPPVSVEPPPTHTEQPAAPLYRPSSLPRTAGWVSLAAGGGALILSGVSLLVALGAKPDSCIDNVCDGSVGAYNTWRTVSTVGFYTGAVLGAAGVTLLLVAPKSDSSAQSLSLTVQATGASLRGSF